MVQLGEHFGSDEHSRHSDRLLQQRWFIKSRREQEKKQDASQKLDEEILDAATAAVLATEIEIAEFESRLDTYDEATVKALMQNSEKLSSINIEIEALLNRAYVMDDGRRVFKTEDGSQVFDEFGAEVSFEELDPALVPDDNPKAEQFLSMLNEKTELEAEQAQLLEFQDKLDAARDVASQDDFTTDELEELDAELAAMLPMPVAEQMPDFEAKEISNGVTATVTATAQIIPKFDPMG